MWGLVNYKFAFVRDSAIVFWCGLSHCFCHQHHNAIQFYTLLYKAMLYNAMECNVMQYNALKDSKRTVVTKTLDPLCGVRSSDSVVMILSSGEGGGGGGL